MTEQERFNLLEKYLDHKLSEQETNLFKQHLKDNPDLNSEIELLQFVKLLSNRKKEQELNKSIAKWKPEIENQFSLSKIKVFVLSAAAILAALSFSIFLFYKYFWKNQSEMGQGSLPNNTVNNTVKDTVQNNLVEASKSTRFDSSNIVEVEKIVHPKIKSKKKSHIEEIEIIKEPNILIEKNINDDSYSHLLASIDFPMIEIERSQSNDDLIIAISALRRIDSLIALKEFKLALIVIKESKIPNECNLARQAFILNHLGSNEEAIKKYREYKLIEYDQDKTDWELLIYLLKERENHSQEIEDLERKILNDPQHRYYSSLVNLKSSQKK